MRRIVIVSALAAACGSSGGGTSNSVPSFDAKGPFYFQMNDTKTVTEVEWGTTEETSERAGRIVKGKRIPGIVKGQLVTKPFTADGHQIQIDLAFDWGKNTGGITIDGKLCEVDMLNGPMVSRNGEVRYRGFVGSCVVDGKTKGFMVGPVVDKSVKDEPED